MGRLEVRHSWLARGAGVTLVTAARAGLVNGLAVVIVIASAANQFDGGHTHLR